MGNFEKLSVLVIGVIIVMILVVALYTWTDDPGEPEEPPREVSSLTTSASSVPAPSPAGDSGGWFDWTQPGPSAGPAEPQPAEPLPEIDRPAPVEPAPAAPEPEDPEPAPAAADRTYTVKAGQTLSHISLEVYGTTRHWQRIAEYNNVDPLRLRPDVVLKIPSVGRSSSATANPSSASRAASGAGPAPGAEYTVRDGDTIQKIAQSAYGTIERWTDIWFQNFERIDNPESLRVGMTLRIPN